MANWLQQHVFDMITTGWLFFCWIGYTLFARRRAKQGYGLSSILQQYRQLWILRILKRDNRIGDAAILANLERNPSFLASTSILVIAGLVTAAASTEQIHALFINLPFSNAGLNPTQLQLKIILLLLIHVFAFFTFTWSMRLYGFAAIMLGATPTRAEVNEDSPSIKTFSFNFAKIVDQAGHSYNYGLRAYYFSMAILIWFFSSWLYMVAVAFVVGILYKREFHSKTLLTMQAAGIPQVDSEQLNQKPTYR